ncbi:MAG: hypothetical protein Q9227_005958 [Pyrenula ochraceoflavens]
MTGNEILISSDFCGYIRVGIPGDVDLEEAQTIFYPFQAKRANSYANYVQSCYSDNPQAEGCGNFVKRRLPSIIDRNATCPFQENICRSQNQNIKLDTGPLDLGSDLGFNLPPNLQFTLRVSHHCAPLSTDGYTKDVNYSAEISYRRYFYGTKDTNTSNNSYTYEHQIPSIPLFKWEDFMAGEAEYGLGTESAYSLKGSWDASNSTFFPNEELLQALTDSDLFVISLSADKVVYTRQVNDDWYSAHRFIEEVQSSQQPGYIQVYGADEPASAIGCKAHYELCSTSSSRTQGCTGSGGALDLETHDMVNWDGPASSIAQWIGHPFLDIGSVTVSMTSMALTSRATLGAGVQAPLPDHQWQSDVEYWHNIVLASFQGSPVENAMGPRDSDIFEHFWVTPHTDESRRLCKSQKILSSAYSNFSILGLAVVFIVGGIIIVLGYTLEHFVDFLETRIRKNTYSRLEWSANDILQTQRMAHEELGIGTWQGCAGVGAVPVTERDQLLAVLDTQDPKHPRLKVSHPAKDGDLSVEKVDTSSTQVGSLEQSAIGSEATEDKRVLKDDTVDRAAGTAVSKESHPPLAEEARPNIVDVEDVIPSALAEFEFYPFESGKMEENEGESAN